jgi:hypothetical protein
LVIGFKSGLVKIIDTLTLKKELFSTKLDNGHIVLTVLHVDKFLNLNVTHEDNSITNLILGRNNEKQIFEQIDCRTLSEPGKRESFYKDPV